MSNGKNRYLVYKRTLSLQDGEVLKSYQIVAPHTAVDCLKAILRNPYIQMDGGEREAEHDIGLGCGADYDRYASVDGFLASGDYERYAGEDHISTYSFFGKYKGMQIEVGFADKGIMTLNCNEDAIDLCSIIAETE